MRYNAEWMKRRAELLRRECAAETAEYEDGGAYNPHVFRFVKKGRTFNLRAPTRNRLVEVSEGFRAACNLFTTHF